MDPLRNPVLLANRSGNSLTHSLTKAIGFLYAGMTRRKAAGTMLVQSLFCASVIGIQF
jgi:Amt family ammonium transporter